MSGLNLLSTKKNSAALSPGYATTGFSETVGAAFTNVRQNYTTDAEIRLIGGPLYDRNQLLKERTGKDLLEYTGVAKPGERSATAEGQVALAKKANELVDPMILRGRKEDPNAWEGIKTSAELREEGKKVAQDSAKNYEDISSRNPSALSRVSASLIGGIGGGFTDPVNVATFFLGAGPLKIAGTGAMAFTRALTIQALKEGTIQASIEAASIPQIADWQNKLGHKYGLAEGAQDVALGFIGGATLRALGEGIVPAYRGVRRGAENVSSYVLDKIATKAPKLDQTVKDSLKYMSRSAYIDEATPAPIKTHAELKEHRDAVQATAKSVETYTRPQTEITGVSKITTPRNDLELEVKSQVMELSDLITSDMKQFNQDLQPRQRGDRASSEARINEIAARLDPAQLGDSRVSNTGSPIIGPDSMVESGNGRVMALRKVYESNPENAAKYKDFLKEQGYDIEGMNNPVLVRQRVSELTPEQRQKFVTFSNEDVADRLSITERALADARLIDDKILDLYDKGSLEALNNRAFIRAFADKAVSPAERNAFITPDGDLSQDGVRRVRGALLAKAYDNADLVQKLLEDGDNNIKTLGNVLLDTAPAWAQLRRQARAGIIPERLDITADLGQAINTIVNARNSNRAIADFANQKSLFAETELSPEATAFLRGMYNPKMTRALGRDKVQGFMDFYIKEAIKVQNGIDLLGEQPLEPMEILIADLEKLHGKSETKGFGLEIPEANVEIAAIRAAGLDKVAKEVKHPTNGMTFLQAVDDMAKRPKTATKTILKTPERLKLHKKIFKELTKEPEGGFGRDRIIELIMGPSGAGKSSVVAKRLKSDMKAIEIDSDIVKERLPEFDAGMGANAVHEESKMISDLIMDDAIDRGLNIVHPIVGSNAEKVNRLVDKMLSKGYTVNIRLVHIPSNESLARVIARFGTEGRAIPPSYVMGLGDGPLRSFDLVKQRGDINAYSYFDNNVKIGESPIIVENNDPRFKVSKDGDGSGTRSGLSGGQAAPLDIRGNAEINEAFDAGAYRLAEYRPDRITDINTEIQPTQRMAAAQEDFKNLIENNPDMMIDLEDGGRLPLSEYAKRIESDQRLIEAITSCGVAA